MTSQRYATVYVHAIPDPETLPGSCQTWSRFGLPVALQHFESRTVFKRRRNLGHEAEEALEAWRSLGWRGSPSSPCSFFRRALLLEMEMASVHQRVRKANRIAGQYSTGPWCEVFEPGPTLEPLIEYDINRAFLASALGVGGVPLELTRSRRMGRDTYVALVQLNRDHVLVPSRFRGRAGKRILVTPEQIDLFGLDITLVTAFNARSTANVVPVIMGKLESYGLPPGVWKNIQSSFWGAFAASTGLKQTTWIEGRKRSETWLQPDPRVTNNVYAQRIIEGVVLKVAPLAFGRTILVHVDNVVTAETVETSEAVGGWRVKRHLPNGVYVESSGLWHDDPEAAMRLDRVLWLKHAGHADLQARVKEARERRLARSDRVAMERVVEMGILEYIETV